MNKMYLGMIVLAGAVGVVVAMKYGDKIKSSIFEGLGGTPNFLGAVGGRPSRPDMRAEATADTTATPNGYGYIY